MEVEQLLGEWEPSAQSHSPAVSPSPTDVCSLGNSGWIEGLRGRKRDRREAGCALGGRRRKANEQLLHRLIGRYPLCKLLIALGH